jgi:uncharacterized protein YfaP (DUF2135 family)
MDDAIAPCVCSDPEADLLRDLIAAGWDQVDVSRVLWGNSIGVPAELIRQLAGQEARAIVRARMREAFPWLHLPEEDEEREQRP